MIHGSFPPIRLSFLLFCPVGYSQGAVGKNILPLNDGVHDNLLVMAVEERRKRSEGRKGRLEAGQVPEAIFVPIKLCM
jgi:hypothetical protein